MTLAVNIKRSMEDEGSISSCILGNLQILPIYMWTVYQYINGDLNLDEEKRLLDVFIKLVFLSQNS